MYSFIVREEDLMPEQTEVLIKATARIPSSNILCVQGVAGSGKTTIALNIAIHLGKKNKTRPPDQKQTILFLTYNRRLADVCTQTLKDKPELDGILSADYQLREGQVNLLTIQDLFKLSLPKEKIDLTLDDLDCIGEIGLIAGERGITELLPSQIYALITTFLRGRRELIGIRVNHIESVIEENKYRSSSYRTYEESLLKISRLLMSTYESWKGERMDRSDIAGWFHQTSSTIEEDLITLLDIKAKDFRKATYKTLGDKDIKLTKMVNSLKSIMTEYQQIGKVNNEAEQFISKFESSHINEEELSNLRKTLFNWIPIYGLRSQPFWSSIVSKLRNPVIIVDEIQDLSAIEIENLVSLWFQLSRTDESRMILLGDLNQQMTPSGFEWEVLYELFKNRSLLYIVKDDRPEMLKPLDNNYRTTPEIAEAVASMLRQVAEHSFDSKIARRILDHSIDPAKTILGDVGLDEKATQIKKRDGEDALVPRVLIGEEDVFEKGLELYLSQLSQNPDNSSEDQVLSTVIITEHADSLEQLLYKYKEKTSLSSGMIEIIPVLACKGLEFHRCALYGLSYLEIGKITTDLVSKWYTSFTRARLQLLIFLTPIEYKFIQKAGWINLKGSVIVEDVKSPQKVAQELEHVGMTELDQNILLELGDKNFVSFLAHHNEKDLIQSLRYYEKGYWLDYYKKMAKQAAEWFEGEGNFEKAAEYYELADEVVRQVHCLYAASLEFTRLGDVELAAELRNSAIKHLEQLPSDRLLEKAVGLLEMDDIEKAFQTIAEANQEIKAQFGKTVIQNASQIETIVGKTNYANLLDTYDYPEEAASVYLLLGDLRQALACALKAGTEPLSVIAQQVFKVSTDWIAEGRNQETIQIAAQLGACGQHKLAGQLWANLGESIQAFHSYISAGDLSLAESYARQLNSPPIFQTLGEAYEKASRNYWDQAYVLFHLSGNQAETSRIVKRLKDDRLILTLANGYKLMGEQAKIEELATESQVANLHEWAAGCWELAERWYEACEEWYQAFYFHRENFEFLLGPRPSDKNVNPAVLRNFYRNLDKNGERYNYKPDGLSETSLSMGARDETFKAIQIVARISTSTAWREDMEFLVKNTRKAMQNSGVKMPDEREGLSVPPKGTVDNERLGIYWKKVEDFLDIYRKRAQQIAQDCFNHQGSELLGIRILYNVCHQERSAEEMALRLAKRSDPESRKLWVKSWQELRWTYDQISAELSAFKPLYDHEIIWYAIETVFQTNLARRDEEKINFRKRLEGLKNARANQILTMYFPNYKPKSSKRPRNKTISRQSVLLSDLFEELKGEVIEELDEDNRDQFILFYRKVVSEVDKVEKLEFRWHKVKESLPDDLLKTNDKLIEQIEVEIAKRVRGIKTGSDSTPQDQQTAPTNIILTGSASTSQADRENDRDKERLQPTETIRRRDRYPRQKQPLESAVIENAIDNLDVINKVKPESIEREDKSLVQAITEITNEVPSGVNNQVLSKYDLPNEQKMEGVSHSQPINVIDNSSSIRRTPKYISRKNIQSGQLVEIDLHGLMLNDALKQFQLIWDQSKNDKSVSGLLINHGHGKDKSPSVIKKELRAEMRRIIKYGRVRKVIRGEDLDAQREDWVSIKTSCPDLDLHEYGENNPGITFIWFKAG